MRGLAASGYRIERAAWSAIYGLPAIVGLARGRQDESEPRFLRSTRRPTAYGDFQQRPSSWTIPIQTSGRWRFMTVHLPSSRNESVSPNRHSRCRWSEPDIFALLAGDTS